MPVGTVIHDAETGEVLFDLNRHEQKVVLAAGGQGGMGNIHFKSSVNRAPRQWTPGKEGEHRYLRMELKVLADVGLLGLPNAGKSTLITRISNAKPKIADYPFTTLHPNLGVVRTSPSRSFVVADIPGLIEGASEGAGLGHLFLRHLARTRVLLHLVDVSTPDPDADPVEQAVIDARAIVEELRRYDPELADKPRWLVLNKLDMVADPEDTKQRFLKLYDWTGPVFGISGLSGEGTGPDLRAAGLPGRRARKGTAGAGPGRRHLRGRRPALRRHALGRHAQGRPDRRRRISHNRSFIRLRLFAPQSALIMSAESTAVSVVSNAQRIVAKVGSSLVTNEGRGLDRAAVAHWAAQIAALRKQGRQVVLVSSGAIAEGMARLGWRKRPSVMHELQAAAAVGQMGLCQAYEAAFAEHGLRTAQILLTHEDLADRHRYLNARSTRSRCCAWAWCPSSTRTTPSSPTRSGWATTIRWARWSPT